jgi:hypothetical protein
MAQKAHLYDPLHDPGDLTPGRRKLIWWCCLIRNRLIALGLRRSQCLHETMPCQPVSFEDFGLETSFPRFMGVTDKLQSIENFIQQCELSHLIAQLLRFQTGLKHSQQNYIEDITTIHGQLLDWRKHFESSLQETTMLSGVKNTTTPIQLTRIFCE